MDRSSWQDGRRAWERLTSWLWGEPPRAAASEQGALGALSDIGLLRRLLDQTELDAVRRARAAGRSWAEIAVNLGITRQSAWEKWRDVDEVPPAAGGAPGSEPSADTPTARAVEAVVSERARQRRRESLVVVPSVIGMPWDEARRVLHGSGLVGVGSDPDGPPLAAMAWPDGVVTDQSPEPGSRVPPNSSVILWVQRGGGSGVREPRRPKPGPKSARELRPEPGPNPADRLTEGGQTIL